MRILKIILNILVKVILVTLLLLASLLIIYIVQDRVLTAKGKKSLLRFYTIISPSMEPTINIYDVIIVKRYKNENEIKVGDIITFYSDVLVSGEYTVTHRIDNIIESSGKKYYVTKGDNNPRVDDGYVEYDDIQGKVVKILPNIGNVQAFISSVKGWIIVILIPAILLVLYDLFRLRKIFNIRKKIDELPDYGYNAKKTEDNKRILALLNRSKKINKKRK